jgi:uncharacterized protein (TIGR03437 family)
MCKDATLDQVQNPGGMKCGSASPGACAKALALVALVVLATFQAAAQSPRADWRRIGNTALDLGLAGLATGPVDRVWYSVDGSKLYARTPGGRIFETGDFDHWTPSTAQAAPGGVDAGQLRSTPEPNAITRRSTGQLTRVYAIGRFAYRSDDAGANWENLTAFRQNQNTLASIVGEGLRDIAVAPGNADEAVIAGAAGVFRTMDGGKTWSGLNQGLPNLNGVRIRSLPSGDRGVRLELENARVAEWQPGERTAWRLDDPSDAIRDLVLRASLTAQRGTRITAVAISGEDVYTGTADGKLSVSPDGGRSAPIGREVPEGGAVTDFWIDTQDSRVAVATLDYRTHGPGVAATHVLRTINGGGFWDDITTDLPDVGVYGVTADRASGTIYVATSRGVYTSKTSLSDLSQGGRWSLLPGLPEARVMDVDLDAGGNRLWAALEGYGIYSTLAPHRIGDPRVVSSADFAARAVAPGSLVSVTGAKVSAAQAGALAVPILEANDTESQLQIPFDSRGDALSLSIESSAGPRTLAPLRMGSTAPAIFVGPDGAPMLLDTESGVMLDAMHPARSRSRIQILTTGLGRVVPDWPAGLPAPLQNPPKVAANVRAFLDRTPIEVTMAQLAPGYTGIYLVEVEIPRIVNYGPAELYIEAGGEAGSQSSNRVRVYIEP